MITKEDIENATEKNGTVNLTKIRNIKNNIKTEKGERIAEGRKKNIEIFKLFTDIYKKYVGIEFKANRRPRFASFRNSKGELETRRYKTDYVRLVEFYNKLNSKYNISIEEFKDYIMHALKISIVDLECSRRNQIFGVVISEKIAEKYFIRKRRKESSNKRKEDLRERHRKHFRGKDA